MANQYERAYKTWHILAECAKRGEIISYGSLGARVGIDHRAVGFVLQLIRDYCLNQGLPPLTVLVVYQSTLKPSEKRIHWDPADIPGAQARVFRFPWKQIENPFQFARNGCSCRDLLQQLKDAPETSEDVYARIGVKGMAEHLFAILLRDVYGNRCAFTRLAFPICLEPAHILPSSFCRSGHRLDVRNGILMTSVHRRLFDEKFMSIDSDYRIVFHDPKEQERTYGPYERKLTIDLHGKRIGLPFQKRHRPRIEWIEKRNRTIPWWPAL